MHICILSSVFAEIEEDGERREEVKRKTERLPQGYRSKGGRRREKIVGRARAIIGSHPQSPVRSMHVHALGVRCCFALLFV